MVLYGIRYREIGRRLHPNHTTIGREVRRNRATDAFVVEKLAFVYHGIMPSVARDVLNVAADGLGTLTLMAGFGAVIGVAALATVGETSRKGLLLIGVTITFGFMLTAFASSAVLQGAMKQQDDILLYGLDEVNISWGKHLTG